MRHRATVLASLTSAAVLVLGLAGSASAANGPLVINGTVHKDPSGCFSAGAEETLFIDNGTDETALGFSRPNCQGEPTFFLFPGDHIATRNSSISFR